MFKQQLKRDITLVVSIKVLIVIAVALFVFGPKQRPHVDDATVRAQLLNDNIPAPADRSPRQ